MRYMIAFLGEIIVLLSLVLNNGPMATLQNLFIMVLAPLFLFSCSSTRKNVVDFEKELRRGSFVFMGYQLEGEGAPDRCLLVLERPTRSGIQKIDFEIYKDGRYIFAELAPAEYRVFRIKCGYEHYKVGNFFGVKGGRFVVKEDQINFVGDSKMVFSEEKDLSFQWGQDMSLDFLRKQFARMHPTVQKRMVSAYTGKSITERMIMKTQTQRSFNARYSAELQGVAAGIKSTTEDLKDIVSACVQEEERMNPLKLGSLVYDLVLRGGRVVNQERGGEHSYSQAFPICLEKRFRALRVSSTKEFEYTLDL